MFIDYNCTFLRSVGAQAQAESAKAHKKSEEFYSFSDLRGQKTAKSAVI